MCLPGSPQTNPYFQTLSVCASNTMGTPEGGIIVKRPIVNFESVS